MSPAAEAPSLHPLRGACERRLLLVTGKGGTGKTALAATLGLLASQEGKQVLVCEVGGEEGTTTPLLAALAPSVRASARPQRVGEGLWHTLLRGDDGVRDFVRDSLPLAFLADRALRSEALRRFLRAAPAFGEMGVLYQGLELLRAKARGRPRFDLLVLDAPASGHTLAFAALPQTLLRVFPSGPIARAAQEGLRLLRDPRHTQALITTLPEPLPLAESQELFAGLQAHALPVGALVANQLPDDPFTEAERSSLLSLLSLAQGQSPQGSAALRRFEQARQALRQLGSLPAPAVSLPLRPERGPELTRALVQHLREGA